jgi:hypothetical protein
MEFINNLLQGSWLYKTEFLGLNGWLWLLIGFAVVMIALGVLAWRLTALRVIFLCLLAVPIFIALIIIWPDLWFLPTMIFVPLFVVAMALLGLFKLVKVAVFIVIAALVASIVAMSFQLHGNPDPNAPKADCSLAEEAATAAGITIPHYFNLEPNKPLNTFGTDPVVRDEAGLLTVLHDRRCLDPALTSAHLASWDEIDVALVDEYTARFIASRELWLQAIGQIEQLEKKSMDYAKEQNIAFSLEAVPAGKSSLYMESNGNGGVSVKMGTTVHDGTALVFTHPDGRVVKLRLECGYQPVFDSPPPGIPECEDGNNCIPDECPPWYPHGNPETGCKDDPTADPGPNGNAPDGNGPNADPGPGEFIAEEDMEQPAEEPRENPAAPEPVVAEPPVVVVQPAPQEPVVVVPPAQPVNNGVVPGTGSPGACNPEFQSC